MSFVGDIPGSDPLTQDMSADFAGELDGGLFDMSDKFPVSRILMGQPEISSRTESNT